MKRVDNPPNPFEAYHCYFEGIDPPASLQIFEDATREILSRNDSPDLGFRWSLNPYRGCFHGCIYCYARPTHEYLGFGSGSDFESKLVVKPRAPELLREAFSRKSWKGEQVVFSGDTDCYQPLEAVYHLTRKCLEVCLEFGNPVGIITKSFLIVRDAELLRRLHERTHLGVCVSIPFYDEKTARMVEPNAASIAKRFEAVRILSEAGLEVAVNVAPVIPGLNDADIPAILEKAKTCGARSAWPILLRLPGPVRSVFMTRLRKAFPLAYQKILGRIRQTRGGRLYHAAFGSRFTGTGEYWEQIEKIFRLSCERLGLNRGREEAIERPCFKRPSPQGEFVL